MILSPRPILALAVLAAVLAACSGGGAKPSGVATLDDPAAASGSPDGSASPSASLSPVDAMVAFAKCMREHGVDMPDPVVSADGGMSVTIGATAGKSIDATKMQAANEACKDLMPGPKDGGPAQMTPEQQDAMLAYAKCMRDHGVDMADPDFGTGGTAIAIDGNGVAFDSPTFKAAEEACRSIVPNALPGIVGTGGGPSISGPGSDGGTQTGPTLHVETAQ